MRISDWSSDVCSSDLVVIDRHHAGRKEDRTQAFGDTRDQDRIDCQGQFPGKRLWRKPARNSLPALRHGMEILIKVMKDRFLGRIGIGCDRPSGRTFDRVGIWVDIVGFNTWYKPMIWQISFMFYNEIGRD